MNLNINGKLDSVRGFGAGVRDAVGRTGRRAGQTVEAGSRQEWLKALGLAGSAAVVAYWGVKQVRASHPQRDEDGW